MKWKMLLIPAVSFSLISASTQAETVLNNLGNASAGDLGVTSNQFLAQSFLVGDHLEGYFLNSVTLRIAGVFDSTADLVFSIYGNNSGQPGNLISTLSTPVNPTTSGDYTYSPSALLLLTSATTYWVVGSSSGSADYGWSVSNNAAFDSIENWAIPTFLFESLNSGATWSAYPGYLQMAVNATPVPEPSLTALLLVGALAFGIARTRQRFAKA